ncbi:GPR1/FUN34/yaaH family-domain-containing protein [Naematelia encephala]|uniref:GPR1/FUN34/yaaH family-domain-containing protein n=1 Tax=Naematelia encephala TaxID=71784 RepID=A0A1Y2B030_9TREE|nr:GPR1/FUN34/yaaH family-domain-containing protein [Naematelia encephala]
MSDHNTEYLDANNAEKGQNRHLERVITPGGHPADFSQPAIPPQHRKYGNPVPLGLTSFGCGFFLASAYTLYARGVHTPNVMVPYTLWVVGNVPRKYIFVTFGVITAYTETDGTLSPQFNQAIGLYLMAWMMVTILFILGSLRSSGAVLATLSFTALAFLTLGIYQFNGSNSARIAGGRFLLLKMQTAWWGAMSGFWTRDTTFTWIKIDPIDMSPKNN